MKNILTRVLLITLVIAGAWLGLFHQKSQPASVSAEMADTIDYTEYQNELRKLLKEYDQLVHEKVESLKFKGEQAFAAELAKSQEDFDQKIIDYQEQLAQEGTVMEEKLTEWYLNPIVNLELQLAMVTLTSEQREEIKTKLARLKDEFKIMTNEYEQELSDKLETYLAKEEEKQKEALRIWEEHYQTLLTQELDYYIAELDVQLQEEKVKLESVLRRAATARE